MVAADNDERTCALRRFSQNRTPDELPRLTVSLRRLSLPRPSSLGIRAVYLSFGAGWRQFDSSATTETVGKHCQKLTGHKKSSIPATPWDWSEHRNGAVCFSVRNRWPSMHFRFLRQVNASRRLRWTNGTTHFVLVQPRWTQK